MSFVSKAGPHSTVGKDHVLINTCSSDGKQSYHVMQQSQFWGHTQKNRSQDLEGIAAPLCSQQQ